MMTSNALEQAQERLVNLLKPLYPGVTDNLLKHEIDGILDDIFNAVCDEMDRRERLRGDHEERH